MSVDPTRLVQATKGIRHHFFTLVDSLSALSSLADLEVHHRPSRQLLADALGVLGQIDGFERSAIFLDNQGTLTCVAVRDGSPAPAPEPGAAPVAGVPRVGLRAPADGPLAEAVSCAEIRGAANCAGLACRGPDPEVYAYPDRGSLLCAPILSRGDVLGAVVLHTPEPDFFEISHEPMLVLFCSVLGYVIDNHRLMQCMEDAVVERTAELSAINRQLELEIEERTRAERHLKRARDEALEAVRVKGRFLANMSHELRTPLNGVLGMLQLLEGTELATDQTEYVEMAMDSGMVLLKLIDEILDFSEVESGKIAIERVEFEPAVIVRSAAEAFATAARRKGLELDTRLGPELPRVVVGDPRRVGQILGNLLGNAVKFTEEGWVRLEVDAEEPSPDGLRLRIEVADSGIGMTDEELERVFRSFTQADATSTRRYGGTGLGLATTKRLIDRMGGTISVTSRPGEGSRFRVVLPCRAQAEPASEHGVPVLEAASRHPIDRAHLVRLREVFGAGLEPAVAAYLDAAPEQVRAMEAALEGGDAERTDRAAGRFRAASRNLGAETLAEMCRHLADQSRRGDREDAERQLAEIRNELGRVRDALARLRSEPLMAQAG